MWPHSYIYESLLILADAIDKLTPVETVALRVSKPNADEINTAVETLNDARKNLAPREMFQVTDYEKVQRSKYVFLKTAHEKLQTAESSLRDRHDLLENLLHNAESERDELRKQLAETKRKYDAACITVSEMYQAAVGEVRGQIAGVIEDVATVRRELDAMKARQNEQPAVEDGKTSQIATKVLLEQLYQLREATWDGNLMSKFATNWARDNGYAFRSWGWNIISPKGIKYLEDQYPKSSQHLGQPGKEKLCSQDCINKVWEKPSSLVESKDTTAAVNPQPTGKGLEELRAEINAIRDSDWTIERYALGPEREGYPKTAALLRLFHRVDSGEFHIRETELAKRVEEQEQLYEALQVWHDLLDDCREKNDSQSKRNEELERKLQKERDETKIAIAKKKNELEDAIKQRDHHRAESEHYQAKRDELSKRVEVLQSEVTALLDNVTRKTDRISDLESKLAAMQAELNNAETTFASCHKCKKYKQGRLTRKDLWGKIIGLEKKLAATERDAETARLIESHELVVTPEKHEWISYAVCCPYSKNKSLHEAVRAAVVAKVGE
jgi:DNA repair exonuclease SbcCD ATPase subunit